MEEIIMSGFGRFAVALLAVLALAALGGLAYQAGLSAGVAQAAAGGTTALPAYGYGWHPWGFGFLQFFGFMFFGFLIFGLLRFAIWGGRGGWHGHHDGGYGRERWAERAREVHDEWHRREGALRQAQGTPSGEQGGS